eukprot:9114716-Alexandrium_andersonii.AAC.1
MTWITSLRELPLRGCADAAAVIQEWSVEASTATALTSGKCQAVRLILDEMPEHVPKIVESRA